MASDPRIAAIRIAAIKAMLTTARENRYDPDVLTPLLDAAVLMLGNMEETRPPDAIITMPQDVTVTPTVQSDGYEFEVQHHRDVPPCNHQHQKLVGNELRCANCDAVLQTTGVIGRNITTAPWARAASEGAPDQPNREGT